LESKNNKLNRLIAIIIYVYFSAGIVWHIIPATKDIVVPITFYGLLGFSILLLVKEIKDFSYGAVLWFSFIVIATFVIEVIGVKTGLIFGNYTYGNVLGLKLLDVPIIIALNWGFVILGIYSFIANRIIHSKLFKLIIISTLTLFFDFLLEPIAIKLEYWNWSETNVPLQNYAAWFIIAFIFSWIGMIFNLKIKAELISHYILAQVIFFLILNILF
jgi:bisanhydrobacterioruberin hydratase